MQISKPLCALWLACCVSARADDIFSRAPSMPTLRSPDMPQVSADPSFTPPSPPYVPDFSAQRAPQALSSTEAENAGTSAEAPSAVQSEAATSAIRSAAAGILGNTAAGNTAENLLNLLSGGNAPVSDAELKKLTEEVEKLKTDASNRNTPASPAQSGLLRFKINGYDLLAETKDVIISSPSQNGSFLISGERKYADSAARRSESFYLLCSPAGQNAEGRQYTVSASLVQDRPDESSLLYQLTQKKLEPALLTGNLFSLKSNDDSMRLELLVDVGRGQ